MRKKLKGEVKNKLDKQNKKKACLSYVIYVAVSFIDKKGSFYKKE